MCWDVSLHSDIELTKQAFPGLKGSKKLGFDIKLDLQQVPAFMFPDYPVIFPEEEGTVIATMNWGVDPLYEKDPKLRAARRMKMVNARSERILEDKRSYWYRLRKNRCLIPVSGTFEHRAIEGWKKKVPYYVWQKEREVHYIPGLYQVHEQVDNDGVIFPVGSFTMITRAANEVMRYIHNDGENKHRMPLFLTDEMEKAWLSPALSENDMRDIFNYEIPDELIGYHPVYSLRGASSSRPDGKYRYEPWEWPLLPPLGNDTPLQSQSSLF